MFQVQTTALLDVQPLGLSLCHRLQPVLMRVQVGHAIVVGGCLIG